MNLVALAFIGSLQPRPLPPREIPLVEDVVLSQTDSDGNSGRDPFLDVGPNRALLIRFPELASIPAKGKKVQSAKIVFTLAAPGAPTLERSGVLRRFWVEGGGRVGGRRDPQGPLGQATWGSPTHGAGRWDLPGAGGNGDVQPIEGVTASATDGTFEITGLGPTVQRFVDDPASHFGFRFTFGRTGLLLSNEAGENKPRLEITWGDEDVSGKPDLAITLLEPASAGPFSNGQAVEWLATVSNQSDLASPVGQVEWRVGTGAPTSVDLPSIAPGGVVQVKTSLPWRPSPLGPRYSSVSARAIIPGESFPRDNFFEAPIGGLRIYHPLAGKSLALRNALVQLNQDVFPRSRTSQAMQGVVHRALLVSDPAKADVTLPEGSEPNLELLARHVAGLERRSTTPPSGFPGVLWWGGSKSWGAIPETRDDVIFLPGSALPPLGWTTARNQVAVEQGGLSLLEVLTLNSKVESPTQPFTPPWPNVVLVRLLGGSNDPIPNAKIEIFSFEGGVLSSSPLVETDSDDRGIVLLTLGSVPAAARDAGWFLVRATAGQVVEQLWLSRWQIETETVRNRLVTMDWRTMLPTVNYDRQTNLALDRIVSDSQNRPPAQLLSLTDEQDETSLSLATGEWFQIDLGRDRALAEVELSLKTDSGGFRIQAFQTGQTFADSFAWVEDSAVSQQIQMRGLVGPVRKLSYRARPAVVRYIRVTATSPLEVSGVRLFAVGARSG